MIRIDNGLPCSYFDAPLALESLKAIIHKIKETEKINVAHESRLWSRAEHIDRDFVESQIWELEEEDVRPLAVTLAENIHRFLNSHGFHDNVASAGILEEVDSLASLMQVLPFWNESQVPRENELYGSGPTLSLQGKHQPWKRYTIGTFATWTLMLQQSNI